MCNWLKDVFTMTVLRRSTWLRPPSDLTFRRDRFLRGWHVVFSNFNFNTFQQKLPYSHFTRHLNWFLPSPIGRRKMCFLGSDYSNGNVTNLWYRLKDHVYLLTNIWSCTSSLSLEPVWRIFMTVPLTLVLLTGFTASTNYHRDGDEPEHKWKRKFIKFSVTTGD